MKTPANISQLFNWTPSEKRRYLPWTRFINVLNTKPLWRQRSKKENLVTANVLLTHSLWTSSLMWLHTNITQPGLLPTDGTRDGYFQALHNVHMKRWTSFGSYLLQQQLSYCITALPNSISNEPYHLPHWSGMFLPPLGGRDNNLYCVVVFGRDKTANNIKHLRICASSRALSLSLLTYCISISQRSVFSFHVPPPPPPGV